MRVLFVCTGNIFRSLTAEHALRRALPPASGVIVGSAGTEDYPYVVRPVVADYLSQCGFDVASHRRRTLTRVLLDESDLVVAMSSEHRAELARRFGIAAPLFTEACGFPGEPLPDVDEAVADYRDNPAAVAAHVRKTIDRIIALTPHLVTRIAPA
jgi:protein-tyrosine-phosphatase